MHEQRLFLSMFFFWKAAEVLQQCCISVSYVWHHFTLVYWTVWSLKRLWATFFSFLEDVGLWGMKKLSQFWSNLGAYSRECLHFGDIAVINVAMWLVLQCGKSCVISVYWDAYSVSVDTFGLHECFLVDIVRPPSRTKIALDQSC